MKKILLPIVFVLVFSLPLQAFQVAPKGKIVGTITEEKTGEPLVGALVVVKGGVGITETTKIGATTDFDGNYTIAGLAPGKYTISISMLSFQEKLVEVDVVASEPLNLSVALGDAPTEITGVVEIKTTYRQESVNSLLIEQKTATAISDGVSAETIKRSPDNTTSDVMKRVSGTSIQDGRFAIIRGLNDRYNIAFINGVPLPSSEADRRAFAFDLFPSNMVDKLVITKAATPDMPADFAGGSINIITKDIPEKNFISFSSSFGFNSITTFKDRAYTQGGKLDWLGVDDGTRAIPDGVGTTAQFKAASAPTDSSRLNWSKLFSNNWRVMRSSALPNGSLQLSGGFTKTNESNGNQFGFIGALSYSNGFRFNLVERNQFETNEGLGINLQSRAYTDSLHRREILVGGMLNFGYKIGQNNKFTFKNSYTINGEEQTTLRRGLDGKGSVIDDTLSTFEQQRFAFMFQENRFYNTQLGAEHFLPSIKLKVNWIAGYSNIQRIIPDFRRGWIERENFPNTPDSLRPWTAVMGINTVTLGASDRFFSTLSENAYNGRYDFSLPVINKEKSELTLKAGGFHNFRERAFAARLFGYVRNAGNPPISYYQGALDTIFDPDRFIHRRFFINDGTNPTDAYTASSTLHAGYLMVDQRTGKLRAVYGLRVESFNQRLTSLDTDNDTLNINTNVIDLLPSINLTFELTKKMNLRGSVSRTVSRPEFRELAPFLFYDFNLDVNVTGKTTLERAVINNYDLRWEYYPSGGELVSVSAFFKQFNNPIEIVNEIIGGGTRNFGYANTSGATNWGLEFEFRKSLAFLEKNIESPTILSNIVFFGNFAYIVSRVDLTGLNQSEEFRPLQGQSPYVINGGVNITDPKTNLGFSFMINRVGRRIAYVGDAQTPDIWENPRTVLDFQISKKFFNKFDIKLTVGDLLAQNLVFYQDLNRNGKFDIDNQNKFSTSTGDNVIFNFTNGFNVSLGLGVKF